MAPGPYYQAMATTPLPEVDEDMAAVLARNVPWENHLGARLLSERDVQLVRRYDKRSEDIQSALLDENGPSYVGALVSAQCGISSDEATQYVLALVTKMLAADPARAELFHRISGGEPADPYAVFVGLLERQDWFTQEKAARVLAAIIAARPSNGEHGPGRGVGAASAGPVDAVVSALADWSCGQLRRPSHPAKSVPAAAAALAALLRGAPPRALLARRGGAELLAPLLRGCGGGGPAGSQLLYEVCLCVWQLSYHRPAAEAMAASGIVPGLADAVRGAQKEKVVRVALLALKNLLDAESLGLAPAIVEAGLPQAVAQRSQQTWGDEDIAPLLEYVAGALERGVTAMSSFDKYKEEVMSGLLDWTPSHTSDAFWIQNISKFEQCDFQVLHALLKLLEASREVRTLAVACHDVGRFVEAHPQGRRIAADLRGKELAMRLMAHPDSEVQRRALLCVQRIMLPKDKLDFLMAA